MNRPRGSRPEWRGNRMSDWLLGRWYRLPLVFTIYLLLHVIVRLAISPALDFDESELVFLSQWWATGYNNQPPMYTWTQSAVFAVLGYSVFALASLKNLFLGGTYWLVYATTRVASSDRRVALVACLGLLTIPQIAWESHRDLSHTIAATFFAAFVLYATVRVYRRPRTSAYLLLGLAVGGGLLSKYNLSMLIVALAMAAISLGEFRRRLLDRRLLWSIFLAAAILAPHVHWMASNMQLASSRTLATMGIAGGRGWVVDVATGTYALVSSLLGCFALTVAVFQVCRIHARRSGSRETHHGAGPRMDRRLIGRLADAVRRLDGRGPTEEMIRPGAGATSLGGKLTLAEAITRYDRAAVARLFERTLVLLAAMLLILVLSGQMTEFKNRWIQPFVIMVPIWFALRWQELSSRPALDRLTLTSSLVMTTVLVAVVGRPLLSRDGRKPNQLNIDFERLVESWDTAPSLVIASDMRVAGNLRFRLPSTPVLSADHPHLGIVTDGLGVRVRDQMLLVSDRESPRRLGAMIAQADACGGERTSPVRPERSGGSGSVVAWRKVTIPYARLGARDESIDFFLGRYQSGETDVRLATRLAESGVEPEASRMGSERPASERPASEPGAKAVGIRSMATQPAGAADSSTSPP